jgi:hypothetical protein
MLEHWLLTMLAGSCIELPSTALPGAYEDNLATQMAPGLTPSENEVPIQEGTVYTDAVEAFSEWATAISSETGMPFRVVQVTVSYTDVFPLIVRAEVVWTRDTEEFRSMEMFWRNKAGYVGRLGEILQE